MANKVFPVKKFSYDNTLKINTANEFFNFQHYLLFSSKQITKFLYYSPVTPHQVIFISMISGILASFLFVQHSKILISIGALFLILKNILDKVDGSLARVKNSVSRRGRFYDSLSDFIVSFSVFSAIAYSLFSEYHNIWIFAVCFLGLISSMMQCSYFVFYELSYIKSTGKKTINRIQENITKDDHNSEDRFTILLQRIFLIIYGWQDYIFFKLDSSLKNKITKTASIKYSALILKRWYNNKRFLSMVSFLSIGTHLVLISLFAVIGKFEYYLFLNIIVGNSFMVFTVCYHYFSVKGQIEEYR